MVRLVHSRLTLRIPTRFVWSPQFTGSLPLGGSAGLLRDSPIFSPTIHRVPRRRFLRGLFVAECHQSSEGLPSSHPTGLPTAPRGFPGPPDRVSPGPLPPGGSSRLLCDPHRFFFYNSWVSVPSLPGLPSSHPPAPRGFIAPPPPRLRAAPFHGVDLPDPVAQAPHFVVKFSPQFSRPMAGPQGTGGLPSVHWLLCVRT